MNLVLHVWREKTSRPEVAFVRHEARAITSEISILEVLDTLNEQLASEGRAPVAFESDGRERICGSCGVMIDGVAHGPVEGTAVCELHTRYFVDAAEFVIEPWRARSSSGTARGAASARRPVPSASASTSSLA